jgi:tetratricopeptide (TPR) repeat protein
MRRSPPTQPFDVRRPLAWAALLLAAAGCSDSSASPPSGPPAAATAPTPAPSAKAEKPAGAEQRPRSRDPRLIECARALDFGDLSRANAILLALDGTDEPDTSLLRARALAAGNDNIGAVAAIESVRRAFPDQGSVYATAAEIHAASGRIESAENEIRAGLAIAGPTPELARARGVLLISREGGAKAGLEHLLEARRADPSLPFCERALAQAHLLLGNASMALKEPAEAVAHARAALVLDPKDQDTRLLLADALMSKGDLAEALEVYEALLADGRDLRTTLAMYYQRAATAALLVPDRPLAVKRYLRARELGLSNEDLGFGLQVLGETASQAIERGIAAYDASDLDAASAAFEEALRCAPDSIEAHNHLGVVRFKQTKFDEAATEWRIVLELAAARNEALPEPVHLNLARALHQSGKLGEVRKVLDAYLAKEPEGEWADPTRAMLQRLDAEVAADAPARPPSGGR